MTDSTLTEDLKSYIGQISHRSALTGVASVDRFGGAPKGHGPLDFLPDAAAVVVIALPIASGLMRWNTYLEDSEIVRESDVYADGEGTETVANICCYVLYGITLDSFFQHPLEASSYSR